MSNNISDLQSHYKTTTAFEVYKFFFVTTSLNIFKYSQNDLNILETHIHFFRKYLHKYAFCILTSNQFCKIRRETPMPEPPFIKVA